MRNLILSLVVLSASAIASTGEETRKEKIWYCEEVDHVGMNYKNGEWETVRFKKNNYVIKQIGDDFVFPNDLIFGKHPLCYVSSNSLEEKFCQSSWGGTFFRLNTETGFGSVSNNIGWSATSFPKTDDTDSLSIAPLKCTTFD